MSAPIMQALYNTVNAAAQTTSTASVVSLTGGKIFLGIGPIDFNPPMVVYQVITDPIMPAFTKDSHETHVQFDVYCDAAAGATAAQAIQDALITQLHRTTATATGYGFVQFNCMDFGGPVTDEDRILRIQSDWRIIARK